MLTAFDIIVSTFVGGLVGVIKKKNCQVYTHSGIVDQERNLPMFLGEVHDTRLVVLPGFTRLGSRIWDLGGRVGP